MYILFKAQEQKIIGPIEIRGRWYNYCVGYLPDTHVDTISYNHLNPTKLEDDVAKAWLFAAGSKTYKGHISVRSGTLQSEQLEISNSSKNQASNSMEEEDTKEKYTLTTDDKENCKKFMQIGLRKILDGVYDHRLQALNLNVSTLEYNTWSKQRKELEEYTANNSASVPLLTALASSRGISIGDMATLVETAITNYDDKVKTLLASKQEVEKEIKDCSTIADYLVLMHNRYDIQMPGELATELSISAGTQFNL